MISNALEWRISTCLSQNIFTMVEEISEFWWSEIHQNEGFQNVHHRISSLWLKKILDFDDLKCSRMKDFNMFIPKYLHHSWRDFWILMIWNTPEWSISKRSSQNIFTMVEKKLGFWRSQMLRNEGFQHIYHKISSPWLKRFLNFDYLKYTRMKNFKIDSNRKDISCPSELSWITLKLNTVSIVSSNVITLFF
jgi:hypothetical protein